MKSIGRCRLLSFFSIANGRFKLPQALAQCAADRRQLSRPKYDQSDH